MRRRGLRRHGRLRRYAGFGQQPGRRQVIAAAEDQDVLGHTLMPAHGEGLQVIAAHRQHHRACQPQLLATIPHSRREEGEGYH